MLAPERETVRTLMKRPGLFFGGAAAALGWLVVQIYVSIPVMFVSLPRDTQPVFAFTLASVGSVLVLPLVLGGLYATVREARTEGDLRFHEVVSLYVLGCIRHARKLFVATVTFRIVALVPAAVVFTVLLAGDTAVSYWQYASGAAGPAAGDGGTTPADAIWDLLLVWLYVMVAGATGRLVLAFYDLPVLFAGVSARRGWCAALRFARRRPRALIRYGGGRFLLWLPMLPVLVVQATLVAGNVSSSDAGTGLVVYLAAAFALGTITTTLLAAYHVVVYERTVEPVLREPVTTGKRVAVDSPAVALPPEVESPSRSAGQSPGRSAGGGPSDGGLVGGLTRKQIFAVSFAFLLVLSMAVGTAAIRVHDVRPMPGDDPQPVEDSVAAEAVVVNAGHLLANGSHRAQSAHYSVNETTGERQPVMEIDVAVDRSNRQAWIAGSIREDDGDEWQRSEYYGSASTFAFIYPGASEPPEEVSLRERFFGETAGEWTVIYLPGYQQFKPGAADDFPDTEDGDWRIVERTDDEVVAGYTEQPEAPDEDGRTLESERVRLTVDAETGRPVHFVRNQTHVERENGTVVERSHGVEETTYGGYEDPEVERPEPRGSRGPVEWLWSLIYY